MSGAQATGEDRKEATAPAVMQVGWAVGEGDEEGDAGTF